MPDLYIDSFKFVCPKGEDGLEIFEIYIRDIISMGELLSVNWLKIYVSAKLTEVLVETDTYPLWKEVEKAIDYLGLQDEIPLRSVFHTINRLSFKKSTVEDKFEIEDILIDEDEYQCVPSYHYSDRLPPFIENYQDFTSKICFCCRLNDLQNSDSYFLTDNLRDEDKSICVKSEILGCDFAESPDCVEFPIIVKGIFSAANNIDDFRLRINPITIWRNAEDTETYRAALDIYIHQKADKENGISVSWSFGSEFINSLKRLKFLSKDEEIVKLLRTLAETILSENLQATHRLRAGKGGGDPQRIREKDGAKAWRRDIDLKFHLHYWKTSDEIEFAWAAHPHDDYYIPE